MERLSTQVVADIYRITASKQFPVLLSKLAESGDVVSQSSIISEVVVDADSGLMIFTYKEESDERLISVNASGIIVADGDSTYTAVAGESLSNGGESDSFLAVVRVYLLAILEFLTDQLTAKLGSMDLTYEEPEPKSWSAIPIQALEEQLSNMSPAQYKTRNVLTRWLDRVPTSHFVELIDGSRHICALLVEAIMTSKSVDQLKSRFPGIFNNVGSASFVQLQDILIACHPDIAVTPEIVIEGEGFGADE